MASEWKHHKSGIMNDEDDDEHHQQVSLADFEFKLIGLIGLLIMDMGHGNEQFLSMGAISIV